MEWSIPRNKVKENLVHKASNTFHPILSLGTPAPEVCLASVFCQLFFGPVKLVVFLFNHQEGPFVSSSEFSNISKRSTGNLYP